MSNEQQILEDNTARLIRASVGPYAKPDAVAEARTWRDLSNLCRARRAVAFPDSVLVILAGLFLTAVLWLVFGADVLGVRQAANAAATVLVPVLAVNLVAVPVAGVFIARRRQHA